MAAGLLNAASQLVLSRGSTYYILEQKEHFIFAPRPWAVDASITCWEMVTQVFDPGPEQRFCDALPLSSAFYT